MSFFTLARELRDEIYRELFATDEPLDLMLLIRSNGACAEVGNPYTLGADRNDC